MAPPPNYMPEEEELEELGDPEDFDPVNFGELEEKKKDTEELPDFYGHSQPDQKQVVVDDDFEKE